MATPETSREPCPDRIVEDCGMSFGMGALGGSAFHFLKGLYNSPNGHRLPGAATAVCMNAPRVGGSFAVWGGLFSCADCALVYARQKEDPWNPIAAGAITGGLLSLRRGLLATGRAAIVGGALLALIEGAGILVNRVGVLPPPQSLDLPLPPGQQAPVGFDGMPPAPPIVDSGSTGTGWFSGLFGRKQQDKVGGGDRDKLEVLELDLPSTAVPSFNYK
ncbi:hypothetical protein ACP70R_046421 [Stipagrostis hirtigluma subsp. patula]